MKNIDTREISLFIINEVYNKGTYANIALANEINYRHLSDRDRRFVTELVYGTLKIGKTLDWFLEQYMIKPIVKLPPIIRNILRLGVYQIIYMSKVPPPAACNNAVELTKKYGHVGTVKFVNAVLRNIVKSPEKADFSNLEMYPAKYLAIKYFHPEWLIKKWLKNKDFNTIIMICEANNQTPFLCVRSNTLKISRIKLLEILKNDGVECKICTIAPEGIICKKHSALKELTALKSGLCQVQDESSMLASHVLDPQPGEFIIDLCSAPGGKSTHIAALMNNQGRVLAVDIHECRIKLVNENAKRLGIDIIETLVMDATNLHIVYNKKADRVLVDVPCSGLGVIRRKSDLRWRKNLNLLKELPKLQLSLLKSASDCVKCGGILVYCTCTTEPEENEMIINTFLSERKDFLLQHTGKYLPKKRNNSMIQFWPYKDGVDGFFIARLTKR